MSIRWTPEQLTAYMISRNSPIGQVPDGEADPGKESVLQGKIEKWCAEWGRPCLSLKQSKAAKRMLPSGWPDCTIIMPGGKVLFLELKSSSGRPSKAQIDTRLQFMALGHTIEVVKSYRRFLEICNSTSEKPQNR